LHAFVFRAVEEVGATLNAALVVMGDKLGLYRRWRARSAEHGRARPADRRRRALRREWLNAQAAGGYVEYDAAGGRYSLAPEQTVALTDADSPAFLPGFFQIAIGSVLDSPRITEAARSGAGVGWHEHTHDVFEGCERFFRPGYNANLVPSWLPALDGVVEKLERGATVADIGCGHGSSTILMAQAYPRSSFVGSDYHAGSIETARARAAEAGVADRVRFEHAAAAEHPGRGYDLVTMFDCLHDMGDPVGAARHVRDVLADDGTWMIVEPNAGDRIEDNLNPVGRAYYAFYDAALHAGVAVAGGRARARRPGRRGADPRRRPRRRTGAVPSRRGDAVQTWCSKPGADGSQVVPSVSGVDYPVSGSAASDAAGNVQHLRTGSLGSSRWGPQRHRDAGAEAGSVWLRRARRGPRVVGGVRIRRAGDPADADVVDRALPPLEGPDPSPRPSLPGRDPRRAR